MKSRSFRALLTTFVLTWFAQHSVVADELQGKAAREAVIRVLGEGAYVTDDYGAIQLQFRNNSDETLKMASELPPELRAQVSAIVLSNGEISATATRSLGSFPSLRRLHVTYLGTWPRELNEVIPKLKELTNLWCQDVKLGRDDIASIGKATKLKVLMLDGSTIKAGEVEPLSKLVELRQLSLSRTGVTSADLACLDDMKHVELLWLRDTSVDDGAVAQLAKLKALDFLVLVGSKVSEKGAVKLADALPHTFITWGMGNIAAPTKVRSPNEPD